MNLKTIAHIQPGYHSKGKVVSDPHGDGHLIQLRDLQSPGHKILLTDTKIDTTTIKEHYHVRHGDILVASRGHASFAVTVSPQEKFVASGHCYLVRPTEAINSDYLCWFLNTSRAQNHLKRFQRGSATPILASEGLKTLDVPVPSQAKQAAIAALYELYRREYDVSLTIAEKKRDYLEQQLLQAVSEVHTL
jgi:restriction endonuclease S subunit